MTSLRENSSASHDATSTGIAPSDVPFFAEPVPGPAAPSSPSPARTPWVASKPAAASNAPGGRRSSAVAGGRNSFQSALAAADVRHQDGLVDWTLVGRLQRQVSGQLSQMVASDPDLDLMARQEIARGLVLEAIEDLTVERANTSQPPLSAEERDALAHAVSAALFGFGRLQPLMDDPRVENIEVERGGRVWVQLRNGRRVLGPRIADSDQELIESLQFLASQSDGSPRTFSQAQPVLLLRLDDGSRLTASSWLTPFPQVAIRRHRLVEVTLDDLVVGGLLPPVAASFLRAAIYDRRSIIVSGAPGSGKTTLVRALIACIPATERLITLETEFELHVHEYRPLTWAFEERTGTGEVGPDGQPAGLYSLAQLTDAVVRHNAERVVVGEVRGPEIIPLVKNAENGSGIISTTHSRDAVTAIDKLVTCGMEAGGQWGDALMTRKLAGTIDLVVHVERDPADPAEDLSWDPNAYWNLTDTDLDDDPGRRRQVTEIVAVSPGDAPGTFATTHVFRTDDDGELVPGVLPDAYRRLAGLGFDLEEYTASQPSVAREEA
ncbi:CpaF family protein [Myceligenerans crystallogenes]|uniref:CpaF/VirB11 family protein n=1 Tax=Myceligenerans crystallogenes TaxID=316335 RepID=A0ABN2NL77_9MICO